MPVTDTGMDILSLVCTMRDDDLRYRKGNLDLLQTITNFSPFLNHRDKMGRTPLHHAAKAGNLTAVTFLVHLDT